MLLCQMVNAFLFCQHISFPSLDMDILYAFFIHTAAIWNTVWRSLVVKLLFWTANPLLFLTHWWAVLLTIYHSLATEYYFWQKKHTLSAKHFTPIHCKKKKKEVVFWFGWPCPQWYIKSNNRVTENNTLFILNSQYLLMKLRSSWT